MIAKLSLIVSVALFGALPSFAQRGLTPVEREACVSFPKVTPADQMKNGIHYEEKSYCAYQYPNEPYCDRYEEYKSFKYFYFKKTATDYYNSEGKLITSKTDKIKLELSVIGDTTTKGEENLVKEIEKQIFNDSDPVCDDSFYK